MAKQNSLSLFEFIQRFGSEKACHDHLYNMKWPNGFECPRCSHDSAYVTKTRRHPIYECRSCRHQTTVTVGTIFERTRTPLRKWFLAIFFMSQDKRGVSALHLSRQLGISYETAWTMQHKIRKAMCDRDTSYQLEGIVEIDDSFFGAPKPGSKRGRGAKKNTVIIALSLNSSGNPMFLKMEPVNNLKGSTVIDFARRNLRKNVRISSDLYSSYKVLSKDFAHEPKEFNLLDNPEHLNWLHTIISNAKRFVKGTYHGLGAKHLKAYLAEYCFRFNRRFFGNELFNRLVNCCVNSQTVTYSELVR